MAEMTKGEIIAAVLDFKGDVTELREILDVIRNRIQRTSNNLVHSLIRPRVAAGETVRVLIRWNPHETREATVIKVNPKRIRCRVDGEPSHRNIWNMMHSSIKDILS